MEHRWTQLVITLFWLATMTWLTVEKILPPMRRGDPPSFRSVYGNLDASAQPLGWTVTWNGSPIGWATSQATHPTAGMTEINSHVHLATTPDPVSAKAYLRRDLYSGVTAVRDMAGDARLLAGNFAGTFGGGAQRHQRPAIGQHEG